MLLLVTMSLNLVWGTTDVPVKVQDTFKKMYPKANFTEWRLDDDVYVVNFKLAGAECESVFERGGKWAETRSTLTADVLSQNAKDAISKKYPESVLEEVVFIEKPNSKKWEVWVETKAGGLVTVVLNAKDKIIDTY